VKPSENTKIVSSW